MQLIPHSHPVQAGSLRAEYADGTLRYLKLGGTELLRMIYFALRDEHWATLPLTITEQDIQANAESFSVRYRAQNERSGRVIAAWECTLSGSPAGSVEFHLRGTFREMFRSRRAGFCVLHPLRDTRGQSFTVTTPAGETVAYQFPRYVAPHQPATNMRTMHWATDDEIACALEFEGDTFEMEDQRNWTDASYKTYCTPLDRPAPVTYQPGDVVEQRVVFRLLSPAKASSEEDQIRIRWDAREATPWPTLGSCVPLNLDNVDPASVDLLQQLPLDSWRADLLWGSPGWEQQWGKIRAFAQRLGKPLHLVLHHKNGDLNQLLTKLAAEVAPSALKAISVVEAGQPLAADAFLQEVIPLLRKHFPAVKVGVGTAHYFTLLNRNRPDLSRADFIFYANSAQVHAFDDASIVETIAGQASTVVSARQFAGDCPIRVSPVGLHARFNPDAAVPVPNQLSYAFSPDPRQDSRFAAGWMVGCLAALAQAGAAHVDFFDLFGTRGFVCDGQPNPTYRILLRILEHRPKQILSFESSNPLAVSALGINTSGGRLLYIVNHLSVPVTVLIELDASWSISWQLDSQSPTAPKPSAEAHSTLLLSPHN
ncbi:MAG: hypothetical protein WA960_13340, partial [Tunicatimonas sp.]